jgi:Na+/H+ antiporter NhaC
MYSTKTGWSRWSGWIVVFGVIGAWLMVPVIAPAQDSGPATQRDTPTKVVGQTMDSDAETAAPAEPSEQRNPTTYGLWVLMPAIVAILLAIFTRQVVPALVVGVFVGAYMMVPCLPAGNVYADSTPVIGGFRLAAEEYVVGPIVDPEHGFAHAKILIFTLLIGFMVGVIGRNGGTAGMVKLIAGDTQSPRRGALTAWLAGLVVFFDDYANTMIVGPTMRSVFDRLKISRAKLAYIVDSTAAPVASLALIGTWVGAEITFIQNGIDALTETGAPAFLLDNQGNVINGMSAFLSSLPYRFYPILALVLVFWIALTGRDFGPMKKAQADALAGKEERPYEVDTPKPGDIAPQPRWWLGLFPVLVLIGVTVAVLVITGSGGAGEEALAEQEAGWAQGAVDILRNADAYLSIFYGALLAAVVALLLTLLARACSTKQAADAGLDGMSRMFPAIVILVLAWALSQVEQDLMLGEVVTAQLSDANFPVHWMPLAVFVCAAVVSFATGTSWTTMGILCPVTVTITAGMAAQLDPEQAIKLFYAAVGSVLAGAIFGDHCSPISDTTVLSSVASGCRHESHVWTQIPYALLTAIVAMGVGDVLCNVYHQPWWLGLVAGAALLFLIVAIVGRRPKLVAPLPQPAMP